MNVGVDWPVLGDPSLDIPSAPQPMLIVPGLAQQPDVEVKLP